MPFGNSQSPHNRDDIMKRLDLSTDFSLLKGGLKHKEQRHNSTHRIHV